ncbi:MAG: hypothetical protein RLZZ121_196 [Bacteroidota bacterium]
MVLGQPSALWGLTLCLVPLYIHFFGFRLRQKAWFTRLDWLLQQQIPVRRRERLWKILLLILRLLAILAMVLAFAEPRWGDTAGSSGSGPRHLIYLDNSPSMQMEGDEGLLLELAKQSIRNLLEKSPKDAQFALITNERAPLPSGWLPAHRMAEWLDRVQVVEQRRSASAVRDQFLRRIEQEGTAGMSQIQTWIFSDFQKNQMSFPEPASGFKVHLRPVLHRSFFNAVIDSAWLIESTVRPGMRNRLVFRTRFFGEWPSGLLLQAELRWLNQRKSLMSLRDEGRALRLDTFDFVPGPAEAGLVTLSLNDPGYPLDNTFFVSLPMHRTIRVLHLVNGKPNPFVQSVWATDTLVRSEVFNVMNKPVPNLDSVDLLVVEAWPEEGQSLALAQIKEWAGKGGTVVLLPASVAGKMGPLPSRNWEMPVTESSVIKGSFRVQGVEASADFLGQALTRRPRPETLPIVRGYRVEKPQAGDRVLMALNNGDPLLLQVNEGEGIQYRFSIPLTDEWSDLVRHDLFVPIWYRLAMASLKAPSYTGTLGGDREWVLPLPASWGDPGEWKWRALDSSGSEQGTWRPLVRVVNGRCLLRPSMEQARPGFYRLDPGSVEPAGPCFALNREPLESDLRGMSEDELQRFYPDAYRRTDALGKAWNSWNGPFAAESSFTRWLIGACLVFLGLEAALLAWRKA